MKIKCNIKSDYFVQLFYLLNFLCIILWNCVISGRTKVALRPGRSLMDWIRLTHSGRDLTSVGGRCLDVSPRELAKHNTKKDAWIALRGLNFNANWLCLSCGSCFSKMQKILHFAKILTYSFAKIQKKFSSSKNFHKFS